MAQNLEIKNIVSIDKSDIVLLFNNNKLGIVDGDYFKNLPPYYMLKDDKFFITAKYDEERLYWGDYTCPIIDIHIDQIEKKIRWR